MSNQYPALVMLKQAEGAVTSAIPQRLRESGAMDFAMTKMALHLALRESSKLRECDPPSVVEAVLKAARLGLDCSGQTGEAYLIPYGRKCNLQLGVQGKIALLYRFGRCRKIITEVVHENDTYDLDLAAGYITHTPNFRGDRGAPLFAYARFWLQGEQDPQQEIMTYADFVKIRDAVAEKNRGKLPPTYSQWEDEMFKRSVISRGYKRLPKHPMITDAFKEDLVETLRGQVQQVQPVQPARNHLGIPESSTPMIESSGEPQGEEPPADNDNGYEPPVTDDMPA